MPFSSAVDALNSIQDIVGDSTMEMIAGGRNGEIVCLSGGYDTTSTTTGFPPNHLSDGEISVHVFPNPSNGIFKVQVNCKNEENLTFRLTDLYGKLTKELLNQRFSSGLYEVKFDVSSILSSGAYILEIFHDKGSIRKKIILTD
jgi:5-hydroxyisourate hydrolase-like protein (transthyretin family)